MRALFEGAGAVRQRLDLPDAEFAFPLFDELRDEGLTDYVALPMTFSDGKIHGTAWASDRPGGFESEHLALIEDLLPVLSLLLEIRLNRRIAINLLDTYVGHHAGERILQGEITRGSGQTVRAAIWFCDLRGFTALSERSGRDELLACLNRYFDCMAGAGRAARRRDPEVHRRRHAGDLPARRERACARAAAGRCRCARGDGRAQRRSCARAAGEALGFGIALHVGEVMYGNIGAADRLDFTVIGPAVNLASRLEALCRTLGPRSLISDDFAAAVLGRVPIAGQPSACRHQPPGRGLHLARMRPG